MSPFPIEAIDEVIWRIDEALGTSDAPKTPMRGWLNRAPSRADICNFLDNLKMRLQNVKFVLTDGEHQEFLRGEGCATRTIVLSSREKTEGDKK